MMLPKVLQSPIDGLRSHIRDANVVRHQRLRFEVANLIQEILQFTKEAPEIKRAAADVVTAATSLREEIDLSGLTDPHGAIVQNLRVLADLSIDRLSEALEDARPSEQAVIQGLAWR